MFLILVRTMVFWNIIKYNYKLNQTRNNLKVIRRKDFVCTQNKYKYKIEEIN